MHYMLLMFFFVSVTLTNIAFKIAAVAAIVYPLLQVLKKFFPVLSGWKSLVMNIAFSIVGLLITTPPDQYFTTTTLVALITAIGTSAGIHGTAQNLFGVGGGTTK